MVATGSGEDAKAAAQALGNTSPWWPGHRGSWLAPPSEGSAVPWPCSTRVFPQGDP